MESLYVRGVALLLEPGLVLLQGSDAIAELIERPGDVAILQVTAIVTAVVEVQGLGALALQQRQLDVVGEQEELVRIRHGGGRDEVVCRIIRGGDASDGWGLMT